MSYFVDVSNGRLDVHLDNAIVGSFQLNDDGQHQLREMFRRENVTEVLCSSSVDEPTLYGGPEIDVHEWIDRAFAVPPMEFGVSVVKSLVARLEKGETEEVIAKLNNWLKVHEGVYGE